MVGALVAVCHTHPTNETKETSENNSVAPSASTVGQAADRLEVGGRGWAQIKKQASKNLRDLHTNIATDKAESDAETTGYVEEKRRL